MLASLSIMFTYLLIIHFRNEIHTWASSYGCTPHMPKYIKICKTILSHGALVTEGIGAICIAIAQVLVK